jgi:hypothetical protein
VQDAVALLSDESANPKLLAGGQSLGPMLNPRLAIVIRGPAGERRVPAERFLIGAFTSELRATEILTAIELPRLSAAAGWGYYRVCRKTGKFAKAIGVTIKDLRLFRILAGSTEGRPLLLPRSAEALASQGPGQAARDAREEIENALSHVESGHRQQLVVPLQRSLRNVSLMEAADQFDCQRASSEGPQLPRPRLPSLPKQKPPIRRSSPPSLHHRRLEKAGRQLSNT